MEISLQLGSILDASADGLVVTVDGTMRGLGGTVVEQCRRRWDDVWDEIHGNFTFPLGLGRADHVIVSEVTDEPFPFKIIFAASILDHLNRFSREELETVLRSAFHQVCEQAQQLRVKTLASPLLKGGWRMNTDRAFGAMINVMDEFRGYDATLEIYCYLQEHYDRLFGLGRSYGFFR